MMNVERFIVGPFQENTYLLSHGNDAILIDPGFYSESEYQAIKEIIASKNLKAIYLTHAHVDHILGLNRVLNDFEVPVYLSDQDYFLWNNFGNQTRMYGLNGSDFGFVPEVISLGESIKLNDFEFKALYTPGHSPDHNAFYFEKEGILIAGDALFRESIGRTDLYKGDFELLKSSIIEQLYTLPENTVVYSGHGPETTIVHERVHNPFVRA